MILTKDEKMLVLLYGDGTGSGLKQALTAMKAELQPDETELCAMTENLLEKLRYMPEDAFRHLMNEWQGGMYGE